MSIVQISQVLAHTLLQCDLLQENLTHCLLMQPIITIDLFCSARYQSLLDRQKRHGMRSSPDTSTCD